MFTIGGTGVSVDNNGAVTLSGSATDVWIFQIAQTLTVGNGVTFTLSGGALASNVFWEVAGSGATLGTTAAVDGSILSHTLIAMNSGATLSGRALAQTAVTLIGNTITRPAIYAAYSSPSTINLSTASTFRILAGSSISIGSGSTNPGDIGLYPAAGSNITNSGTVTGTIYTIDGANGSTSNSALVSGAQSDLTTAYGVARGKTANATLGPELGNTTLGCGVYASTSGSFDITGTLTLSGSATDIFIFQTTAGSGTLTTAASSKVSS